ncbi:MAG: hypothetical protein ACE5JG_02315 [Planctomycetota bacterium]
MRPLPVLLALAVAAQAAPKREPPDEVHPRSPTKPLEIVLAPWYCPTCLEEGRIEGERQDVRIMRRPLAEILKMCDVRKGATAIVTPHFKILSLLKSAKVKWDTRFAKADARRLKTIFPRLKIGLQGIFLNAHQRAHLYHVRVERLYAHFSALTANTRPFLGMEARYQVLLFRDYSQHHALTDQLIGRSNDKAGVQHHDKQKPNFMAFTTADDLVAGGERHFSNHVMHNVAHNLIDGWGNYYRETWAFIEEGLAHYYERREAPSPNTFCWAEGAAPTLFNKPQWSRTIRNMVLRKKDPPLGLWCEKLRPGELSGVEQGLCWSLMKWMVETDPVRFTRLLEKNQDRKNKPTAAEAIRHAFGVSPNVLHERWRAWVLQTYGR